MGCCFGHQPRERGYTAYQEPSGKQAAQSKSLASTWEFGYKDDDDDASYLSDDIDADALRIGSTSSSKSMYADPYALVKGRSRDSGGYELDQSVTPQHSGSRHLSGVRQELLEGLLEPESYESIIDVDASVYHSCVSDNPTQHLYGKVSINQYEFDRVRHENALRRLQLSDKPPRLRANQSAAGPSHYEKTKIKPRTPENRTRYANIEHGSRFGAANDSNRNISNTVGKSNVSKTNTQTKWSAESSSTQSTSNKPPQRQPRRQLGQTNAPTRHQLRQPTLPTPTPSLKKMPMSVDQLDKVCSQRDKKRGSQRQHDQTSNTTTNNNTTATSTTNCYATHDHERQYINHQQHHPQ